VPGLAPCSENQLPYLAAALRGKRALLVLDNCEHLSGAAVALAKDVSRGVLGVQILSISREPMQVEGERVHRPASLASPVASNKLTAAAALTFPAVQLFIESAAATLDGLKFGDAEAARVAAICRNWLGPAGDQIGGSPRACPQLAPSWLGDSRISKSLTHRWSAF
jgi:predicted ATPase